MPAASLELFTEPELPTMPEPPVSPRSRVRLELEAIAESFLARWDEYANWETKSSEFGFDFTARQTEHEGNVWTIAKAFIPGFTLEQF